eukprot:12726409-Ditylum_brightwellii.AAC.1
MKKVVKCWLMGKVEEMFHLVEALLKGGAFTYWLELKQVEMVHLSKNPDGTNTDPLEFSLAPKSLPLQPCKKPNKLNVKNITAQLCNMIGMLVQFPGLGNTPTAEDELCNILYQMVKHDWQNALHKLSRTPMDMSLEDLVDYFEQTKLLEVVKQKSKTIMVNDNNDKKRN